MCGAPTSGDDPPAAPDAEALARAGWSDADLTWEHVQEAAAEAAETGDWETAANYWETGLDIARESFGREDPRLAASLANQACAERRAGRADGAAGLFSEALAVWDSSAEWVAALTPERRARSSTYHLRLQRAYPSGYDRHSEARYQELAEEGRARLEAASGGKGAAGGDDGLARWRKERPAGYTDGRKLLAAALLIAAPPS